VSDIAWFAVVFVAFFILRAILATWVFLYLLPIGDRCPNCDSVTVRVRSPGWNKALPWFRTSWCQYCGWEGLLRNGPATSSVKASPPERATADNDP
jgi:hypothetical protein